MRKGPLGLAVATAILLVAATVWGLMVSVGASRPTVRLSELPDEGFESRVGTATTVLELPWGEGPEEAGISYEGEAVGPMSFGLDDRDRIYLLDQVNRRVLRFDGSRLDASFALPDPYFDDIAVSRDRFVVLSRDDDRRALVFDAGDAEGGLVATLPVDPGVGGISGLFIEGPDVAVECSYAALFTIGTLEGRPASAATQRHGRPGRPAPGGKRLHAAVVDRDDVRVDVTDASGATTLKVRTHSRRDVGGILDCVGDRFGNVVMVYNLRKEHPNDPDKSATRLVIAKYSSDGELVGRAETANTGLPTEPLRPVVVSEAGDVYQMASDGTGIKVLRWTLSR